MTDDVPSPIDLLRMQDAREWERTAMEKRPWRTEFFKRISGEIAATVPPVKRILELGSGPGFLAQHLLQTVDNIFYVMLDFSAAMHELARARLGELCRHVEFVERDFKQPGWNEGLGEFECIVTVQAVHELRHKRYATDFHARVRKLLAPGGIYLICDHYYGADGMKNDQLYMTVEEQRHALSSAGLRAEELLRQGGMVLHKAVPLR